MATKRAFAYNPSKTPISGVTQVGDIAVGGLDVDNTKWSLGLGGLTWWAGPDEELGWVIAKVKADGDQPNSLGVPAYIGFNRSALLTDESFIEIVNKTFNTSHITASSCKTYLESNGYWTNWEEASAPAFEFTVNTSNTSTGSTATNRFKLPLVLSGTINFSVDWGDSSSSTITLWNQAETTHTYASAGAYTIKIVGEVRGWRFSNGGDRLKILNIASWGDFNITVSNGFQGCTNLTSTATDSPTISTSTLAFYFNNCTNFNGDVSGWNISGVTGLIGMFSNARAFNQPLNSWNTSNVIALGNLFSGATAFNQPLSNWNTSKVNSLASVFANASSFNQSLNTWDTSKVATMANTFGGAISFNQSLSNWNTSSVTTMFQMFYGATAFNQDISMWNVSKVTTGNSFMFNKTAADYSASYLDAIYNTWSLLTLKSSVDFDFGTIKYTSAGAAGKAILLASPNSWSLIDGGQI